MGTEVSETTENIPKLFPLGQTLGRQCISVQFLLYSQMRQKTEFYRGFTRLSFKVILHKVVLINNNSK